MGYQGETQYYLFIYLFKLINSVEVHPQLSHNGHPVDGVLVSSGSLWLVNSVF